MIYLVFKQNKNKIETYINNKLINQIPVNIFITPNNPIIDINLHNFLVSQSNIGGCIVDGEIKISAFTIQSTESSVNFIIYITVGTETETLFLDGVGEKIFYCDIIKSIVDTMVRMKYDKIFKIDSIKNLWGVLG